MSTVNKVILVGHVGTAPELKKTKTKTKVAEFTICTNSFHNGEQTPQWHRVIVFDKTAESCIEYLEKGRLVYVEGRLQTRKYEKDGVEKLAVEIVASMVQFLGKRDGAETVQKPAPKSAKRPKSEDDEIPFE